MRVLSVLFALVAAASLCLARPAHAGPSDAEKVLKLVRKLATDEDTVFDSDVKPRTLCHCKVAPTNRLGFLVFDTSLHIRCAIPTTISAEGEFQVVEFGCVDFEILSR